MGYVVTDLALSITLALAAAMLFGKVIQWFDNRTIDKPKTNHVKVTKLPSVVNTINKREDVCQCYYCTALEEQGAAY